MLQLKRVVGGALLLLGLAVFLIRLQHAGPYGFPAGGNLLAALAALGLGTLLVVLAPAEEPLKRWLCVGALIAALPTLFFGLYATLAELEEVVVLYAEDSQGQPRELRLWIVDHAGEEWVTMARSKANEHSLADREHELLRAGETRCVVPKLFDDREAKLRAFELRSEKYSIQRLAILVGIFSKDLSPTMVALRMDPCP